VTSAHRIGGGDGSSGIVTTSPRGETVHLRYLGSSRGGERVKLEEQVLITPDGVEPLTTYPSRAGCCRPEFSGRGEPDHVGPPREYSGS